MPEHVRVFLGLLLGLACGIGGSVARVPALAWTAETVEPVGRIWLAFVKMGVLPLVVATLVEATLRIGDLARLGRLGARALAFLLVATLLSSSLGVATARILLPVAAPDPDAVARLREGAEVPPAPAPPNLASFLVDLVPSNPAAAAAAGSLLPLLVFTLLFAAGATRVGEAHRNVLRSLFGAVASAAAKILAWAMRLAPVGVFALAAGASVRVGLEALGGLLWYVLAALVALAATLGLVLYPAARLLGRVPLAAFQRAAWTPQVVAFSTTSSLATLPALFEAAQARLRLSRDDAALVLPLSASIFRPGGAAFLAVAALFLAQAYGVAVSKENALLLVPVCALTAFSVPGVPAGSVLAIAPVLATLGVPYEGVALLLAVDRLPDMCRTAVHATGHLAALLFASRDARVPPPRAAEPLPPPERRPARGRLFVRGRRSRSAHEPPPNE